MYNTEVNVREYGNKAKLNIIVKYFTFTLNPRCFLTLKILLTFLTQAHRFTEIQNDFKPGKICIGNISASSLSVEKYSKTILCK